MASPHHMLRMEEDAGDEMLSAKEDSIIPPFFANHPQYTNLGSYDTDDNEEEEYPATSEGLRGAPKERDIDSVLRRYLNLIDLPFFCHRIPPSFSRLENETMNMPNGQGCGRNFYWIPYNKELMRWRRKIRN